MCNYEEWDLDVPEHEEEDISEAPYIDTEEECMNDGDWQEYWKETINNYKKILKEIANDDIWKKEMKRRLEIAEKELFILQNK